MQAAKIVLMDINLVCFISHNKADAIEPVTCAVKRLLKRKVSCIVNKAVISICAILVTLNEIYFAIYYENKL